LAHARIASRTSLPAPSPRARSRRRRGLDLHERTRGSNDLALAATPTKAARPDATFDENESRETARQTFAIRAGTVRILSFRERWSGPPPRVQHDPCPPPRRPSFPQARADQHVVVLLQESNIRLLPNGVTRMTLQSPLPQQPNAIDTIVRFNTSASHLMRVAGNHGANQT
jgi:hypothetical protein